MLAGPNPADLLEALALPVPTLVICELLGVPYADRAFFQRVAGALVMDEGDPAQAMAAGEELNVYLDALVEAKNAAPGNDVLSRLAVEQYRSGAMTRREISTMGQLLLVAGHDTTANMIARPDIAYLPVTDLEPLPFALVWRSKAESEPIRALAGTAATGQGRDGRGKPPPGRGASGARPGSGGRASRGVQDWPGRAPGR